MEVTLAKVVPRLIWILVQDGRTVKPCLIQGDLWKTNIGTNIKTGNLYIFDAAAYYAHSEMEIRIWRVDHHKMKGDIYRQEYVKRTSRRVSLWNNGTIG
ncbi:hypothetical protein AJ78_07781 [Emergomyces pasteurianus Ep9510]|uniref:Protein-ribulosamine 3-kinase n=1 Tax=Emergomyces pasteurianus Ep9510 TaxID=1447872 RepID=A0A1J9P5N9_9EURO|nr:hypothetical protein AJ78_07781 [Emergomyces pasteurianus Ep9510]